MPVTDAQVAALRAFLIQDFDEARKLVLELGEKGRKEGYFPLLTCAFMEAVTDRFDGRKQADIDQWIASARNREHGSLLDPEVAETLIKWVFGNASAAEIDAEADLNHQTMLLTILIEEKDFDDEALESFVERVRTFADAVLNGSGPK